MIVISTGCPASVGPEISVKAAAAIRGVPRVLVGDEATLLQAADLVGVPRKKLRRLGDSKPRGGGIYIHPSGPKLSPADRAPGKPTAASGRAQLIYVEDAFALAKANSAPLVTAAVSKAAIALSGDARAKSFRGHTEWLEKLDGAEPVTMCFIAERLATSLVTTHIPLKRVPKALNPEGVRRAIRHLERLVRRASGKDKLTLAVCSLNPHAGESELLGSEETSAILPGISLAKKQLYGKAKIVGPIGAETAYRLAAAGEYDGVVAMYHDQATIPMKLLAFGDAVNVTMGLSIVRTSVDHGTAYDIAWRNQADAQGMLSAMQLAAKLAQEKKPASSKSRH